MPKGVKPVEGEPLRYWVESSEETPHFVDLSELNGNGECSCSHFRYRCLTRHREQGRIINHGYPDATRCKHINTAMLFMADQVIYAFNENQKKSPDRSRSVFERADPEVERLKYHAANSEVRLEEHRREPIAGGHSNSGEQSDYDWTQG